MHKKIGILLCCLLLLVASTLSVSAQGNITNPTEVWTKVAHEGDMFADMDAIVPGIQGKAQVVLTNDNSGMRVYYLKASDAVLSDFSTTDPGRTQRQLKQISDSLLDEVQITVDYHFVTKDGSVHPDGRTVYQGPASGKNGIVSADIEKSNLHDDAIYLGIFFPDDSGVFIITMDAPETLDKDIFEYSEAKIRWEFYAKGLPDPVFPPDEGGSGGQPDKPVFPGGSTSGGGTIPSQQASSVDASDIRVLEHTDLVSEIPLPQTGGGVPQVVGNLAPILLFILIALLGLLTLRWVENRKKANQNK